jgi:hypothetical protein
LSYTQDFFIQLSLSYTQDFFILSFLCHSSVLQLLFSQNQKWQLKYQVFETLTPSNLSPLRLGPAHQRSLPNHPTRRHDCPSRNLHRRLNLANHNLQPKVLRSRLYRPLRANLNRRIPHNPHIPIHSPSPAEKGARGGLVAAYLKGRRQETTLVEG